MELADEIKVGLVTAVCVLGIAVIFKSVLRAQAGFMVSTSPVYLFIAYVIVKNKTRKPERANPLYWSLAIIFVALLTIGLYAI